MSWSWCSWSGFYIGWSRGWSFIVISWSWLIGWSYWSLGTAIGLQQRSSWSSVALNIIGDWLELSWNNWVCTWEELKWYQKHSIEEGMRDPISSIHCNEGLMSRVLPKWQSQLVKSGKWFSPCWPWWWPGAGADDAAGDDDDRSSLGVRVIIPSILWPSSDPAAIKLCIDRSTLLWISWNMQILTLKLWRIYAKFCLVFMFIPGLAEDE